MLSIRPRVTTTIFIVLALILATAFPAKAQIARHKVLTNREIAQKALRSTVMVIVYDAADKPLSFGSGFFVVGTLVATNHHVIKDAKNSLQIRIKVVGRRHVVAIQRILSIDTDNDLALLELPPQIYVGQSLKLGNGALVGIGDSVYVSGNPEGLEGTFSAGIVSNRRNDGGKQYLQITAPISHGSSGGPVLNRYGEVIGIALAILKDGQNLNFAVPVSYLSSLITRSNTLVPKPTNPKNRLPEIQRRGAPDPTTAEEYHKLGNGHRTEGRYSDAIVAYKKSLRINPDFVDAYISLGWTYIFNMRQFEDAAEAFKEAIKVKPDSAEAYRGLGASYEGQGQNSAAVESYKRALSIQPDSAWAYEGLGSAYRSLGRLEEAVAAFKTAILLQPDGSSAFSNLGESYEDLGRYQEAIEAYKQSIRLKPELCVAHYQLGCLYDKLNRFSEAADALKEALRLEPAQDLFFAHIQGKLGRLYALLERFNEATIAYKEAIRINPKDAISHYGLGLLYVLFGVKGQALGEYSVLKSLNPQLAEELFNSIYK